MRASYKRYVLNFKRPSGTSRGVLHQKETWFLILEDKERMGIGECGLFRGLSSDDVPDYEAKLKWVCQRINNLENLPWPELKSYPSIQFGIEQAMLSVKSEAPFILFPSAFAEGKQSIPINGLVWMGNEGFMMEQIEQKLEEGFNCIKLKIGAIAFKKEIELLAAIRKGYNKDQVELRVDANGAFQFSEALEKLKILSDFNIHSIEQPIKQGRWKEMADLCQKSPIPIALDEELIGVYELVEKKKLLQTIKPQYIILKPSLLGGFKGCEEWITLANEMRISWWVTSALESNIGLNAIAQWTYTLNNVLPQGLGTGELYTNNFDSPLKVKNGKLFYERNKNWKSNLIKDLCI